MQPDANGFNAWNTKTLEAHGLISVAHNAKDVRQFGGFGQRPNEYSITEKGKELAGMLLQGAGTGGTGGWDTREVSTKDDFAGPSGRAYHPQCLCGVNAACHRFIKPSCYTCGKARGGSDKGQKGVV